MNCHPASWPSDVCSSGDCIEGVCVCSQGWTGSGDFFDLKQKDCHINILAVNALWSVLLAMTLIVCILSVKVLRAEFEMLKKEATYCQKFHYLIGQDGILTVFLTFCQGFLFGILCITKLSHDVNVGESWFATLVFSAAGLLFWFSSLFFTWGWTKLALSYDISADGSSKILNPLRIAFTITALVAASCFFAVLMMLFSGQIWREVLAVIHFQGQGLVLFIFGRFVVIPYGNAIQIQLNEAYRYVQGELTTDSSTDTSALSIQRLIFRLNTFLLFVKRSTLFAFIIGSIIAWWPWLRLKAAYELPFMWTIAQSLCVIVLYLLFKEGKEINRSVLMSI